MASKHQMIATSAEYMHNLDADKVLERFGKFGRYQMFVYLMASLNFFLFSYKTTVISLIADPHPNCTSSSTNDSASLDNDAIIDDQHLYRTLATDFGIGCEDKHMLEHANGAFMLGNFVFTALATYLADRFGRRLTFLVSLWAIVVLSVACAFAPSYEWFLLFRFLSGAFGAAIVVVGFVLTVESVAGSFRSVQVLINSLIWVSGILAVGVLHLFIFDWRFLYLCVAGPGLFSIAYYWLFPESLHWLIANRKTKQVKRYISRASRINNVTLNLHSCQADIGEQLEVQQLHNDQPPLKAKRNFFDLCRTPALLLHLVLNCYIFIVMNFVYWVLTLYSVKLHEQKMVGFFLSAAVEVPAGILAMLMLFCCGRRTVTIVSLLGQAVSLGLTIMVPHGSTSNLLLSLAAKVFNGISWASEPLLLSEMSPTTVRNMMYGIVATMGEIGSVFAPYLDRIGDENVQKVAVTVMSVLAILFALVAPETSGRALPQDLADFDAGPFVALVGRVWKRWRNGGQQNTTEAEEDSERALKGADETETAQQQNDEQLVVGEQPKLDR
uniref:Major facilitator superfamily (MFS) profile domain-containing protein n=1 Tax=Globodera rostochiensis TaxID=31243 RepID=A0A914GS63_GLORO